LNDTVGLLGGLLASFALDAPIVKTGEADRHYNSLNKNLPNNTREKLLHDSVSQEFEKLIVFLTMLGLVVVMSLLEEIGVRFHKG
jgi:hypothetical protein